MAPQSFPLMASQVFGLALSLICAPTLIAGGEFASLRGLAVPQLSASAQDQPSSTTQQDFDEDAGLEQPENLTTAFFQAVYVNRMGEVLGTFVDVPGAKIQVYANGQLEIESRDYTTEITYHSSGRPQTIGNSRLTYFRDGRIRSIDGVSFSYYNNGQPRTLGGLRLAYFNSGKLRSIDTVAFEYRNDGVLNRLSSNQTNNGIRVIVVD